VCASGKAERRRASGGCARPFSRGKEGDLLGSFAELFPAELKVVLSVSVNFSLLSPPFFLPLSS